MDAVVLNPCPTSSLPLYPRLLNALFTLFSDIGLSLVEKRYLPPPVYSLSFFRTSTAWVLRGTTCSLRSLPTFFIVSLGITHCLVSKLISFHSALLSSPGRTNNSGASCNALLTGNVPLKSSIFLSNSPIFLGSVILA